MTVTYTRTTWPDGVVRHAVERGYDRGSVAVSVTVGPVDVIVDVEVNGRLATRMFVESVDALAGAVTGAIEQSGDLRARCFADLVDPARKCGLDVLREVTA